MRESVSGKSLCKRTEKKTTFASQTTRGISKAKGESGWGEVLKVSEAMIPKEVSIRKINALSHHKSDKLIISVYLAQNGNPG